MSDQNRQLSLVPVGEPGREYMRTKLSMERGYSKYAENLICGGGNVFALVPEGTNLPRVRQFDVGGLSSPILANDWLSARTVNRMLSHSNVIFLVHDVWMTEADIRRLNPKVGHFYCDDSVYYYCENGHLEADVSRTITFSRSFKFVAACCEGIQRPTSVNVSSSYIQELSENTIELYLGAYDQEGLLLWQP